MAIRFRKHERQLIPSDPQSEKRVFPIISYKYDIPVNLKEFAKKISKQSILGEGEVYNTLNYFCALLQELLLEGKRVNLDGLGSFYLALKGKGAESMEEFTTNDITGLRICFRASNDIRIHNGTTTRTDGLVFIDLDKLESGEELTEEEDTEGGDDTTTETTPEEGGDNPLV